METNNQSPFHGKQLIFIGGLHRSGTSLLHQLIRSHPEVSGFYGTGVPEDEGQHLQTVYPAAVKFGGPGRFGFDPRSFMDESHELARDETARAIYAQWSSHWDLSKRYLVEKSPPNMVRARFLQTIFPGSQFLMVLRHPLAVSYATQKWNRPDVLALVEHSLLCMERMWRDLPKLHRARVIRYEELVAKPESVLNELFVWLGLPTISIDSSLIKEDLNREYFSMWESEKKSSLRHLVGDPLDSDSWIAKMNTRAQNFGYEIS